MYGRQEMLDRFDEIDQELDSPQTPLQLIGRGAENEVYQARFRNERLAHKIVLGQYSVQIEGQLYPYSGVRPIHEQVRVVDKKILGQLSVKGDKSFAQMLGASYQKCQMVQELIGQPADSIAVLIGSDSHFLSKLPSSNQRQIAQVVKTAVAKGVASDIHLGNIVFDPETNRSVLVDFARRRRGCERIDLRIAKKGLPPEISQYL